MGAASWCSLNAHCQPPLSPPGRHHQQHRQSRRTCQSRRQSCATGYGIQPVALLAHYVSTTGGRPALPSSSLPSLQRSYLSVQVAAFARARQTIIYSGTSLITVEVGWRAGSQPARRMLSAHFHLPADTGRRWSSTAGSPPFVSVVASPTNAQTRQRRPIRRQTGLVSTAFAVVAQQRRRSARVCSAWRRRHAPAAPVSQRQTHLNGGEALCEDCGSPVRAAGGNRCRRQPRANAARRALNASDAPLRTPCAT